MVADAQLPLILNQLGAEGWELAAIGDIALTGRSEIVMKKRISDDALPR
jgi:hypothetical protein